MRKHTIILALLMVVSFVGGAQEADNLDAYMEAFQSGSVDAKLEVVRRAGDEPAEEMSPLYAEAARYLEDNADRIEGSSQLVEMTRLTASGAREAGATETLAPLRSVFENLAEPDVRSVVLRTLGELGGEDRDTIQWLGDFLDVQNNLQAGSGRPNTQVVRAAVEAAARISDPSFFEPLLSTALAGYSADIEQAATEALFALEADTVQLAAQSIGNRAPGAKLEALEFFLGSDEVGEDQKSAIAAAAVRDAIATETEGRDARDTLRRVRFTAAEVISENEYTDAADAMIDHFNETILEYDRGQVTRSRVLDTIEGLGNMDVEAAGERLSRFLELLNRYTENDRPYDTRIVMATIRNLEKLGYPVAYNPLFYASILEAYPKRVQDAAGEAMDAVR